MLDILTLEMDGIKYYAGPAGDPDAIDNLLVELTGNLDYPNTEDTFQIYYTQMTKDEFEALDEFDGF